MKYASVCSGIGAPECAWQSFKDWECVFHAEIESFPAAIYGQHFNSKNYGDIAKFKEWPEHAIDLLVGGTPCQSFSVAGLRKGLDDPRGNLALVFLGIVDRYRPAWVLWENVPGVHSSWSDESLRPQSEECQNTVDEIRRLGRQLGIDSIATIGNSEVEEVNQTSDFDCFLSGLEQLGYGVATTILDAQYRGLAQRRERVFVVGCAGGQWQRAAAVLFDWSCVRGDSAPSRETGQRIAPTVESRANAGGAGWGTDFLAGGGGMTAELRDVSTQPEGLTEATRNNAAFLSLPINQEPIPLLEVGKREGLKVSDRDGIGVGKSGDPMFALQSGSQHGIVGCLSDGAHNGGGRNGQDAYSGRIFAVSSVGITGEGQQWSGQQHERGALDTGAPRGFL